MPLRNCLNLPVSSGRAEAKTSGAKLGIGGKRPAGSSRRRGVSPSCTSVALTRPTTSPGNASSIVSRSCPNTVAAYLVANGLPVRSQVTTMPRSNRPEQTRAKAMRSRWGGSMLACTLNTNAENGASRCAGLAVDVGAGVGVGSEVDDGVEQLAHAEVGERRTEEHGRRLAGEERLAGRSRRRRRRAGRSSSVACGPRRALLRRGSRSASTTSSGASCAPRAVRVKRVNSPVRRSITPRKSPRDADRPRDRRGAQADLLLDLVEQLERLAAGAVALVEEGEQRQVCARGRPRTA